MATSKASPKAVGQYLARFDTFLVDCDGVVWSGEDAIAGAPDAIRFLEESGKRILFVTNNSTQSRKEQSIRLNAYGMTTRPEAVFNSAFSAAVYLSTVLDAGSSCNKVFVLGQAGIEDELDVLGIPHIGGTDPQLQRDITSQDLQDIADGSLLDSHVGAVVVGIDVKINYLKLCLAAHYILRGAIYLATNLDATFPAYSCDFPAAGCIISALQMMVKKDPILVGKPAVAMMDALKKTYKLNPARTCMIGDSLDTDMPFAINGGLGGRVLVMSGVTRKEDVASSAASDAYKMVVGVPPTSWHPLNAQIRVGRLQARATHNGNAVYRITIADNEGKSRVLLG